MKENKFFHIFHKMPATARLFLSLASAILAYLVTINNSSLSVQIMFIWISFALVNLILFWITIITASSQEIKRIAKVQDSSRMLIFFVVLIASVISLVAIILLLRVLPKESEAGYYAHIILTLASVICSWLLIHTIFTYRYSHLFYSSKSESGLQKKGTEGLRFPSDPEPDYLDFAYFSFVIGMTFQVSDVQITSNQIRRLALLHGVLSFGYNTAIVALSINIISGFIKK